MATAIKPAMLNSNQFNEAQTCYNVIDPLLIKIGWDLAGRHNVGFEIPVDGYDASPINGITDYCLYRDNGEILAVIKAKRTCRDARVGKKQLFQYLTKIEQKQSFRPLRFLTGIDREQTNSLRFYYSGTAQSVFVQNHCIEVGDLYEAPFTKLGLMQWRNCSVMKRLKKLCN